MTTEHTKSNSKTRTIAVITIVALALGLTGGWAIAALTSPSRDGDLWVLAAGSASVSTDEVVLTTPSTFIEVTIGDDREAQAVAVSTLVQDWDRQFGDTMPPAVVTGLAGGTTQSIAVRLGAPEATADSITFTEVEIVGGGLELTELTGVTLIIDAAGLLDAVPTV